MLRGRLHLLVALACLVLQALAGAGNARAEYHVQLNESAISDPAVLTVMRSYLTQAPPAGPGTGKEPPPPAERARADCDKLAQALRAFGYLEAQVTCRPATASDGTVQADTFIADPEPGDMFRVGIIDVSGVGSSPAAAEMEAVTGDRIASYPGKPATAEALWAMETDVLRHVRDVYPLASVTQRSIHLDPGRRLAMVDLAIESGPTATFGDLTFSGLGRVPREAIRKEMPFQAGQPFDGRLVDEFQRRLQVTHLFQSVRVEPGDRLDQDGRIGIIVSVKEFRQNVGELRHDSTPLAIALLVSLMVLSGRLMSRYAGGPRWLQASLSAASFAALAVSAVLAAMRVMQLVS